MDCSPPGSSVHGISQARMLEWVAISLSFPSSSAGKESTCIVGHLGPIPGLAKGYLLQYSGLENSMDCIVHEVAKSWTRLSNFRFTCHFLLQKTLTRYTKLFLNCFWSSVPEFMGENHPPAQLCSLAGPECPQQPLLVAAQTWTPGTTDSVIRRQPGASS